MPGKPKGAPAPSSEVSDWTDVIYDALNEVPEVAPKVATELPHVPFAALLAEMS